MGERENIAREILESNVFKEHGYRPFVKRVLRGLQKVHTPYELCYQIIGKLAESVDLKEQQIAVLVNVEFVIVLLEDFGVSRSNITFVADSDAEAEMARSWYGIKNIHRVNHGGKEKGIEIMPEIKKHFNCVIMNPPYQSPQNANGKRGGGHTLWDKFIEFTIDKLLVDDGFLCCISPAGWRGLKAFKLVGQKILSRTLNYLEIHDVKDGLKTFSAGTRYDWYVLQNTPFIKTHKTLVKGQLGNEWRINLSQLPVIPNDLFDDVLPLLCLAADQRVQVLQNSAYHTQRDFMDSHYSKKHKFPCVHHVNVKGEPLFWYSSSNNSGHFGIPKVIFGRMQSGIFVDQSGDYGLTQDARAIIAPQHDLHKIAQAMQSEKFLRLCQMLSIGAKDRYEVHMIRYLHKDFWREFI